MKQRMAMFNFMARFDGLDAMIDWLHSIQPCVMQHQNRQRPKKTPSTRLYCKLSDRHFELGEKRNWGEKNKPYRVAIFCCP